MSRRAFLTAAVACWLLVTVWADTCNIDGGSKQQVIDGFGFSTAWCGKLSAAKNNALYKTLGMSLLRIRFDENGNFNDERDNAAAAHAAGAKVFGSAWTAPPRWNSNGRSSGGYLLTQHYAEFANWLKNAANTVGVDWVSFINEPDFNGANGDSMTEPNCRAFLKTYGKSLGKPIIYPEAFQFNDAYSDPALNDPEAAALITIVGGHIYGGGNRVHQNALNKGKHVWQTEHYLSGPNDIRVCTDEAQQVSQLLNNKFSAYVWWWVNDGLAPNENLVQQSGNINLIGYTLGQFAKFIRPGSVRVASTYSPTSNVFVTAYTGTEFVIVAVNKGNGGVSQAFSVKGIEGLTSLTIHRTDGNGNKLANVGTVTVAADGTFTVNLPGQSISTIHGSYSGSAPSTPVTCGSTTAEGDSLTLSCAAGQTIGSVDFASYGTPTGDCQAGFVKSTCDANTTLAVFKSQCVGKNTCSIAGSNDVFGDPCPTIIKHVAAKVTCLQPELTCGTAAENANLDLGCSGGRTIKSVSFASYGLPDGTCPTFTVNSNCHASSSQAVVEKACVGKTSCTVPATNDVFTDPCSGTIKKLSASIVCSA